MRFALAALLASLAEGSWDISRHIYYSVRAEALQGSTPDSVGPFVDRRDPAYWWDMCPLGAVKVLSQITETKNSRILEFVPIPEHLCTVEVSPSNLTSEFDDEDHTDGKTGDETQGDRKRIRTENGISPSDYASAETKVAKYSVDCSQADEPRVHPLVDEFTILAALNNTGIAPGVYFLSKGERLRNIPFEAVPLRVKPYVVNDEEKYYACAERGAEARFMVMDKVGPSVAEYVSYLFQTEVLNVRTARAAVKIARKSLALIEKLHSYGFLHGNIHGDNIRFKDPFVEFSSFDLDSAEFVLIGFGPLSSFFPDQFGSPNTLSEFDKSDIDEIVLTPWELRNIRAGRRDDVFRLFDQIARWFQYRTLPVAVQALLDGAMDAGARRAMLAEIKSTKPLFGARYWRGEIPAQRAKFEVYLEGIISALLKLPGPDSEVPYAAIRGTIGKILALNAFRHL